ncbi:cytochrome P450 [Mycena floridula]|nr:cytochrome P450 [Mycena floridula]
MAPTQMFLSTKEVVVLSAAALILLRFWQGKKCLPLPPGPPGVPILGNLFDFPLEYGWLTYGKWADTFGPLISLTSFGTTIVVVNSATKATELCDKKSPIYSSRPYLPMAFLMGWKDAMGFQVYGPRFRSYRKVFHNELGNSIALENYWPQEEAHGRNFINECLTEPDRLAEHCFQHAGAIVLRVSYGYTAKDQDDPFIKAGNDAMESFNKGCAPGTYMVNQMPILRYIPEWFPGAGFQKQARLWRPLYPAMIDLPFNFVKSQMAAGTAEPSFTSRWLEKGLSAEDEDVLKHASGSMFGGGGETTAVVVHMYFLAMARYPEIQEKVQAEMDAVVGRDRLPSFEDRAQLPYLEALSKEVMRHHPAVPSGLPHCTTEDDIHDGYFIPKGSIIICNIWIHEILYLVLEGRLLADASVYITLAMCAAALKVAPVVENGKPLIPEYQPESGSVSHIKPFKCTIAPRYPEVMSLVRE